MTMSGKDKFTFLNPKAQTKRKHRIQFMLDDDEHSVLTQAATTQGLRPGELAERIFRQHILPPLSEELGRFPTPPEAAASTRESAPAAATADDLHTTAPPTHPTGRPETPQSPLATTPTHPRTGQPDRHPEHSRTQASEPPAPVVRPPTPTRLPAAPAPGTPGPSSTGARE